LVRKLLCDDNFLISVGKDVYDSQCVNLDGAEVHKALRGGWELYTSLEERIDNIHTVHSLLSWMINNTSGTGAASAVHNAWMVRNPAEAEECGFVNVEFEELPKAVRENYSDVVRLVGEAVMKEWEEGGVEFIRVDEEGIRETEKLISESINIIDLGSGGGRDVAFLAEELKYHSSLATSSSEGTPCNFRVYGIDYHPGSPKRCLPLWLRWGVEDYTELVKIDLRDQLSFREWREGLEEEGVKVWLSVRYFNREVLGELAEVSKEMIFFF